MRAFPPSPYLASAPSTLLSLHPYLSLSLSLSLSFFPPHTIHQIFGWLASFIWFASIWFVYKDTFWHKDRTGPLAKLYQQDNEGEGRQEGGGEASQQRK